MNKKREEKRHLSVRCKIGLTRSSTFSRMFLHTKRSRNKREKKTREEKIVSGSVEKEERRRRNKFQGMKLCDFPTTSALWWLTWAKCHVRRKRFSSYFPFRSTAVILSSIIFPHLSERQNKEKGLLLTLRMHAKEQRTFLGSVVVTSS